MNLRKGFRIITVISIIASIGGAAWGIYLATWNDVNYWWQFILIAIASAFASFVAIWLIYWIIYWLVRGFYKILCWSIPGFHKIGKEKILKIIKWAVIIFLASVLFHLADYVVHKTTKFFEEGPKQKRKPGTFQFGR